MLKKQASKSQIYGTFVNARTDEELIFAIDWRESLLTIIERSIEKVPQTVQVFRSKVTQINSILSQGECIERGYLIPGSPDVYKTVHTHSGKSTVNFLDENIVTISEFKLENPHLELTDPRKNIGFIRFDFIKIRNEEKVEVSKYLRTPGGKELLSHRLFSRINFTNRRWEDVPISYEKLSDVKEEMWKLKFMIRHSCCFEDCQRLPAVKCSRCHHYTCSRHSTEQFEVDQNESSGSANDVLFEGEIVIKVICGHCSGMYSEIACLKWY